MRCFRKQRRVLAFIAPAFILIMGLSLIDILSFEGVHASQIIETHTKFSHLENTEKKEEVDGEANLRFLFAVFIITWAFFFIYVFIMARRQRELTKEIETLKTIYSERNQKSADPNDV